MNEFKLRDDTLQYYDDNIADAIEKARSIRGEFGVNKSESLALESSETLFFNDFSKYSVALNLAVRLLRVPEETVLEAEEKYNKVGEYLCEKLNWDKSSIEVFPQGSVSTKTLIKSADGSNFDIDAVCKVDLSIVEMDDPIAFFEKIGKSLNDYYESDSSGDDIRKPEAKRRCWKINYANTSFYLEFTPSVVLSDIDAEFYEKFAYNYKPTDYYKESALAVVDVPTKKWKASNPKGFADWITDISSLTILQTIALEALKRKYEANVEDVSSQEIDPNDTLRTIIILFKRHRDMTVKRRMIDSKDKPISVLLVTLITNAYFYLCQSGKQFIDPVSVMLVIAELLKKGPRRVGNKWYVENPTVEGENFSEKWNDPENGKQKYDSYCKWCGLLVSDMKTIVNLDKDDDITQKVLEVFGLDHNNDKGPKPKNIPPKKAPAVPPTNGLA